MESKTCNFAETAMLIRKPAHEVYRAFIDPEITTKFWFTSSSGPLKAGETITWTWEMFKHSFDVVVKELVSNEKITLQWGDDPKAIVIWTFEALDAAQTFVTIKSSEFEGSQEDISASIRDSTGGFTWVLAGLKAYLEHGVLLNVIADRYPNKGS